MIESISISNVATYGSTPEVLDGLSQFNYIYGANGTGKTTISRLIAEENKYPTCSVKWKHNQKLETYVYNADFVERNFTSSNELKGVFTLGEQEADTLKQIAEIKAEIDGFANRVIHLTETLQGSDGNGGKKAELSVLEADFKSQCWKKKTKYDSDFQAAFKGFRGSAESFRDKILYETGTNTAQLLELTELQKKASSLYGSAPVPESPVQQIAAASLIEHETDSVLNTPVIGSSDVNIAAMINALGNADWVRTGRGYYEKNNRICPFCQQRTDEIFAQNLSEYFNETYDNNIRAINALISAYSSDADTILSVLDSIIANPSKFIDTEKLKSERQLLESRVTVNKQRLLEKRKEPSRIIELEALKPVVEKIEKLIREANEQVAEHNRMVSNLKSEQNAFVAQVWRFVLEELEMDIILYKKKKDDLQRSITGIQEKITKTSSDILNKSQSLQALENSVTSIQPTIDGINGVLNRFGFHGFRLIKTNENSYRIIRTSNGTDAKVTLSEGEKSFITFLYFYHLLKGSNSESNITTDRVVVFDDPVSSLDSEILFIVSSLIKGLFDEVRKPSCNIKQVFVLTHNVYFHKEITFNPNRKNRVMNEETFWVVRKVEKLSRVEKHDSNPVKTSYDLLWSEIRNPNRCNFTIQNTLRRILENYFKILGGINFDEICDMFEGKDKLICKSLFSWAHDGSHYALDDLYVSIDSSQIESYLTVFRQIFERSKHGAHYKMMMNIQEDVNAVTDAS